MNFFKTETRSDEFSLDALSYKRDLSVHSMGAWIFSGQLEPHKEGIMLKEETLQVDLITTSPWCDIL